jgi:predicted amidohydrolase YtcJ
MARWGLLLWSLGWVYAQAPDTILVNGKILSGDELFTVHEALAVRGEVIAAVGTTREIRALAGPRTRVIDLGGRTVIPGLIDSHMHAIRAALSFASEVNWVGTRSIAEALERIREAARSKPPGAWLIVAGGWTPDQFAERRPPTQAELQAAAPDRPVYVQLGYSWAMLTPAAQLALALREESSLPVGAQFERGADGRPTGAVTGPQSAIVALFDRLPKPTYQEQLEGTRKFFRELNRLGITGVVDPGGNNLFPADYQAVQQVWRERGLTVRIAYALNGQTPGREFEELENLTQLLPMGFGDDFLRFNGIGERITFAMNNNDRPTAEQKERFLQIARWAAGRGMALTMHWPNNASVSELLEVFEAVNRDIPIGGLRWSIAHLADASEATLRRMRDLGVGWTVQNASYFGAAPGARMPALQTARRLGVAVGAGTDAHRVMSYNPFAALQWLLEGKTIAGQELAGMEEAPGREQALRLYTVGSAWFARDEARRGTLEVGKLADLAVLNRDYMTVPVREVHTLEAVLTMVGGRVVYSAPPF